MGSRELKLNEFKALHKWLTRNMPDWLAFLVLGFLVWVEEKFINQRIKTEIDSAIKEYKKEEEKVNPSTPIPVYSETGSGFFDEMRLTAPWVDREHPSDSP
jgi:predicted negative regulator of RcsB-dependent stress response